MSGLWETTPPVRAKKALILTEFCLILSVSRTGMAGTRPVPAGVRHHTRFIRHRPQPRSEAYWQALAESLSGSGARGALSSRREGPAVRRRGGGRIGVFRRTAGNV